MSTSQLPRISDFIRQLRITAELSQEQLAELSGVSVRTISDLERGQRANARLETLRLLADALGLDDMARSTLIRAARQSSSGSTGVDAISDRTAYPALDTLTRIPQPVTSFHGRSEDLAEVLRLIRDPLVRIVNLTGPGGTGKTRLALELLRQLEHDSRLCCHFVQLAALDAASLVPAEIGKAFGLIESDADLLADRIAYSLQDQPCLLVLDNFERLVDVAPLLTQLTAASPSLTILVTSRVRLHVSGEVEYRVRPLTLADSGAPPERALESPAVRLFLDRAGLDADHLSPENVMQVSQICARLDGLPLAIELAAAKMRFLTLSDLQTLLIQRLSLLDSGPRDAPPRLRSMRDAIAWSYDLLTPDEQALFRSLSVFDGGFTLDAVEATAPPLAGPATSVLFMLMDHNLVFILDATGEHARYSMLETIREFALDSLVASGEEFATRERHLDWFVQRLGHPTIDNWLGPQRTRRFELEGDQENLRSALSFALSQDFVERAAQMAWGLTRYWTQYSHLVEAETTLGRLLEPAEELEPDLVAAILHRQSFVFFVSGDLPQAAAVANESLRLFRQTGNQAGVRAALSALGTFSKHLEQNNAVGLLSEALSMSRAMNADYYIQEDLAMRAFALVVANELEQAHLDATEAVALGERLPAYPLALCTAQIVLAWIAGCQGNIDEAERLGHQARASSDEFEMQMMRCLSRKILGETAFARGNLAEAERWFQSALEIVFQSTLYVLRGYVFAELAMVASAQGDSHRAALLYGAARSSWEALHFSEASSGMLGTWCNRHSPTPEALDSPAYRRAFEAGLALSDGEAFAIGMAVSTLERMQEPAERTLSARELDVLRLIAEVHTNQEIADELFISKRTVDRHVLSLLSKLDAPNRRVAVSRARDIGILPLPALPD